MIEVRTCSKCFEKKDIEHFYYQYQTGKYRTDCKACCKVRSKKQYDKYKKTNEQRARLKELRA